MDNEDDIIIKQNEIHKDIKNIEKKVERIAVQTKKTSVEKIFGVILAIITVTGFSFSSFLPDSKENESTDSSVEIEWYDAAPVDRDNGEYLIKLGVNYKFYNTEEGILAIHSQNISGGSWEKISGTEALEKGEGFKEMKFHVYDVYSDSLPLMAIIHPNPADKEKGETWSSIAASDEYDIPLE